MRSSRTLRTAVACAAAWGRRCLLRCAPPTNMSSHWPDAWSQGCRTLEFGGNHARNISLLFRKACLSPLSSATVSCDVPCYWQCSVSLNVTRTLQDY